MKEHLRKGNRFHYKYLCTMSMLLIVLIVASAQKVQARENYPITLAQYHPTADYRFANGASLGTYFEQIYPNPECYDYKKFMKYTYVISDDSVFGLKANTDLKAAAIWLSSGRIVMPYDISVYAIGPGTATLKVYDGKKLIDIFSITVKNDQEYSPSSYMDLTEDKRGDCISWTDAKSTDITSANIKKENKLIKKFAKVAADPQNTTTSQRIRAALGAVVNHGSKQIFDKEYKELQYNAWKKGINIRGKYQTAHSMLIEKKSLSSGFAIVNKAVLNNLGYSCSISKGSADYLEYGCEEWNYVDLSRNDYGSDLDRDDIEYMDGIDFGAAARLMSDDAFKRADADLIYRESHLPAWIIGQDTKHQVVKVGETIKLSSCDLNNNIYSSDPSVVTVENGSITGVSPGVAIVYRYNETYCDVFFVTVKNKGAVKTIKSKIYTNTTKTYFNSSEYAPYIRGGQAELDQMECWQELRPFYLEEIFGNGSRLETKYSKGTIECYTVNEHKTWPLYTVGSDGK